MIRELESCLKGYQARLQAAEGDKAKIRPVYERAAVDSELLSFLCNEDQQKVQQFECRNQKLNEEEVKLQQELSTSRLVINGKDGKVLEWSVRCWMCGREWMSSEHSRSGISCECLRQTSRACIRI